MGLHPVLLSGLLCLRAFSVRLNRQSVKSKHYKIFFVACWHEVGLPCDTVSLSVWLTGRLAGSVHIPPACLCLCLFLHIIIINPYNHHNHQQLYQQQGQ